MQQLGWIKPLTHQRAVEIVTAAHVPQAGGKLVGLVAQLANRQRLAQGIPGRRGQGGDGAAQAAAQRARQPGQAIPDARAPEIAVVSPKELITAIAAEAEDVMQQGGALLDQQEMKIIFGLLPPILKVHTEMLCKLEAAEENWSEAVTVGSIILQYTEDILR